MMTALTVIGRERALKMPPAPKPPVFKPPVFKPSIMPIDPTFILRRTFSERRCFLYRTLLCAPLPVNEQRHYKSFTKAGVTMPA
jgi:hypothetical protein